MPTIVELTDRELAELRAYTKASDDAAAVRLAMTEYLRLARRVQLKQISGQVSMEENWQSLEAAEVNNRDAGSEPGSG
jgi:hypothetical protein